MFDVEEHYFYSHEKIERLLNRIINYQAIYFKFSNKQVEVITKNRRQLTYFQGIVFNQKRNEKFACVKKSFCSG